MARIIFSHYGKEYYFRSLKKLCGHSWNNLAKRLNVSDRQLRDWRKGVYSFPDSVSKAIKQLYGLDVPEDCTLKQDFWYISEAAKKGGIRHFELYGSPGTLEGRRKGGINSLKTHQRYNTGFKLIKKIRSPEKTSRLAEILGALMGDGSLSIWQARITLNLQTDRKYGDYLTSLFEDLFNVKASKYERLNYSVLEIIASSKKLIAFLKRKGLPVGNKLKQQLDIPRWIYKHKDWQRACLRGLFDTDGCTYIDRHKYKNFIYNHICIAYTSYSMNLIQSIYDILKGLGYSPTISSKRNVLLRKENEVFKFFQEFKPSNDRHHNKLKEFLERYRSGYNGIASKAIVAAR